MERVVPAAGGALDKLLFLRKLRIFAEAEAKPSLGEGRCFSGLRRQFREGSGSGGTAAWTGVANSLRKGRARSTKKRLQRKKNPLRNGAEVRSGHMGDSRGR
jgi:hypothetical protein